MNEEDILAALDQQQQFEQDIEQQVIDALSQAEQEITAALSPELKNLAETLSDGDLQEIAAEAIDAYEQDLQSRGDWEEQRAHWRELYYQTDAPAGDTEGRDWAATESIPILTEACNQFQSRTFQAFFPNKAFVSAAPTGRSTPELMDRARRIGRHMSYQLSVKNKNYRRDKDAMFLSVALDGSAFTKTYYDPKTRMARVENIRAIDLVVPYHAGPISIEELDRKTHVIVMTIARAKRFQDAGWFSDLPIADDDAGNNAITQTYDNMEGLSRSNGNYNKFCTILEQHTFLDLDGTLKPYIVWVCKNSKKVLRLSIRYDVDEQGNPTNDYEPIEYFTHYKFMENPDGFYGLGMGHMVGQLNESVNFIMRTSMDAAHLACEGNMSGFISERLSPEGDDVRLSLGVFSKVPEVTGDLQSGIFQFQFPGPNAAMVQLGQYLINRADRLASTTEALTGASTTNKQATTILTEVEQGLQLFTSVQLRLSEALGDELEKVFKINQKYLPLVDYYTVNDVSEQITRDDYRDDMRVLPVFDPRFATQAQKIARAQAELDAALKNPVNASRPEVIDAAFRRYLETIESDNIDELVPPPQPPAAPEYFGDQQVENTFFLLPKDERPLFDVSPMDDHAQHLSDIDAFVAQYATEIDPETADMLKRHRQKHVAFLYAQQTGVINGQAQSAGNGNPQLVAQQGNPMGMGQVMRSFPAFASPSASQLMGASPFAGGATSGNQSS